MTTIGYIDELEKAIIEILGAYGCPVALKQIWSEAAPRVRYVSKNNVRNALQRLRRRGAVKAHGVGRGFAYRWVLA